MQNMADYTLHEVKNKKEAQQFLDMAVELYCGYDNWIRPLDNDINAVFDPEKNERFKTGEAIRWILKDKKGKIVGRIAAFYDQKTAAENEQPTGGCGFFECINDQHAANIMFDAAKEWLIQRDMEAMDGSVNFGDRDQWWGVLVDGFSAPLYGMSYNHIYYKELFEGYGFQNYFNQYTYYRPLDQSIGEIVKTKYERLSSNPDYSFRHIRMDELDRVGRDFVDIYNKAWAGFNGVADMSYEQGAKLIKTLKPVIDERLIYFAYYKGGAIGFFVQIPNINQVIRHLDGKLNLWGKLKFYYLLKIKKSCDTVLSLIFGVIPEHQGKGIESGMIETFRREITSSPSPYKRLELAWMGDFNPLMLRMVETYVEARILKTHVTFRYLFDRNKPFTRAPRVSRSRVTPKIIE